jgi:hypothetical protein
MRIPVGALKQILIERRTLAQKEQQVLSRILDALPGFISNGTRGRKPGRKAIGRKLLICSRCDRRFTLPMHLGRHLAASHTRRRKAA